MKSGITKIMAVLATMLAFSSCEKEKELLSFGSDDRAIRIIPEIASPYTKSNPITDGKETEFNKGDMIALLCNDGHVTYKLTDKGWQTTDNYYLRWGSAPVSYSAFYPATEKTTTFGNFELQSSQRTADRLAAADYMTCTVEDAVKTSDGSLRLKMERQMAKVSFTLSGIAGSARVQGFRVWTSTGFTEGQPNSDRMYISPYIAAAEGAVSGQNGTTYTAIVVPSEADDSKVFVTFNYKGKDITLTGVPELKKGFRYDMDINIAGTIISIGSPSVAPWDESTTVIPGGDAEKVPLLPYFVKPVVSGNGNGLSWDNAMGMADFLKMIRQKNGTQAESDENADNVDDRDFYFIGGTYSVEDIKVEYSGYGSRVQFRVHGGYDPASKGTDISSRNAETVFDGSGSKRFLTLGNQTEPTFDGITFANLKSNSEGCILLASGGGESRANFTNCTFRKCTGSGGQNPILMIRKGLAKLNNVTFDGCRADGGVRGLIRLVQKESRVYLNACTFINNTFGGGGFGLLVHLNDVGGNVCMHNVTFAGNDNGCGATGVVNGTGGMLIASSTIVASNYNPAIRCESNPNSGSRLVNSLIIQERDQTAIDMSSSGRKLKSLGGNVVVGSINVNNQYEASSNDDAFANRAAAAALKLEWNYGSRHYLWNGTTTFTKFSLEPLRAAIKSYSNTNTGKLYAGSTEVYDGSKAGEDFLKWLDSINAFDIYKNSSAVWPGSYQGN
uniref:fimbrillin family protein n=1 Tax=Candidatus Cryptobacteroides bacterium TaxID=3085639 RepID=UPI003FF08CEF